MKLITGDKINYHPMYNMCTSCKEKLGYNTAFLYKFPNKSERIGAHLLKKMILTLYKIILNIQS